MPTSSRRAASTPASGASSRSSRSSPMSEHDDEILGKAYDPRLMRRVWSFARPHRRIIFLSMALFPLVAALALLQRQDAAFMDRNPVGRLMTRLLNDVEAISELFASGAAAVVGDVLTLAGIVVLMLVLNWELALVTFALVPVLAVGAAYFRLKARDSYRRVRIRLARLNAFLQESLQGMAVIQIFA